jgi:hypothetical protein
MTILDELLAATDPALAEHAVPDPGPPRFADVSLDPTRRLVLEAVYEGHLLHHGTPRLFAGMDADLQLLAGDALYALGLARLAAAEDLVAVAELAALISHSARARAERRLAAVEPLWDASAERLSH